VPELQALLTARYQGTVSFSCAKLAAEQTISPFVLAHAFLLPVSQRCKHFEIGGDKKGKGTSLF